MGARTGNPPAGPVGDGSVGRRVLLAVGCKQYEHQPALKQAPATLDQVEKLFCDPGGLGYERVALGLGNSPSEVQVTEALGHWFKKARLQPADVVAVWFSCHGHVDSTTGRLRLALADSAEGEGIDASLLGEMLAESGVQRALVIMDCCHGEGGTAAVLGGFEGKLKQALDDASRQPEAEHGRFPDAGFVFIAASGRDAGAAQGDLVAALEHALRDRVLGGFTAPALDPRRVVEVVNEHMRVGLALVATGPGPGPIPPVLPNLYAEGGRPAQRGPGPLGPEGQGHHGRRARPQRLALHPPRRRARAAERMAW